MHEWMQLQRQKITDGSATAKALDYSLRRCGALTRFLDDGQRKRRKGVGAAIIRKDPASTP